MKMNKDNTKRWDHEIIKSCPVLYCMASRPMDETCMCWGFECGEGWRQPLELLSKKLEAMNLLVYPLYRVRIQACQVKEKFGCLAWYFDVIVDPPAGVCFKRKLWQKLYDMLRNIDYKPKTVKEHQGRFETYDTVRELTAEEYEQQSKQAHNSLEIEYTSASNGRTTKYYQVHHHKREVVRNVSVPTKHGLLYALSRYARQKMFSGHRDMTPKQEAIVEFMHDYACKQVNVAIKQCENHCEECGAYIGDDYSPTCTTTGWIKLLCEDCAIKRGHQYYKGKQLYLNGKPVSAKKSASSKNAKKHRSSNSVTKKSGAR